MHYLDRVVTIIILNYDASVGIYQVAHVYKNASTIIIRLIAILNVRREHLIFLFLGWPASLVLIVANIAIIIRYAINANQLIIILILVSFLAHLAPLIVLNVLMHRTALNAKLTISWLVIILVSCPLFPTLHAMIIAIIVSSRISACSVACLTSSTHLLNYVFHARLIMDWCFKLMDAIRSVAMVKWLTINAMTVILAQETAVILIAKLNLGTNVSK